MKWISITSQNILSVLAPWLTLWPIIPLKQHMDWYKWIYTLWRHQLKGFYTLLTICEGKPPVTSGILSRRRVTRSFDVFFDLRLNKRLCKPSRRRWVRCHRAHYDVTVMICNTPTPTQTLIIYCSDDTLQCFYYCYWYRYRYQYHCHCRYHCSYYHYPHYYH